MLAGCVDLPVFRGFAQKSAIAPLATPPRKHAVTRWFPSQEPVSGCGVPKPQRSRHTATASHPVRKDLPGEHHK
jgi:hypothetical protein